MKSSKNAHKIMHRRTNAPQLGKRTVRRWRKVEYESKIVASEEEVKKRLKGRNPSKRLADYVDPNKPPTLADIWPENHE